MDDIYFSKQKGKKNTAANRQYDLPPVNSDKDDVTAGSYEDVYSNSQNESSKPQIPYLGKRSVSYAADSEPEGYAPYRAKKSKQTKRTGSKNVNKQRTAHSENSDSNNNTPRKKNRGRRFLAKLLLICFATNFIFTFFAIAFSGYTKAKLTSNAYCDSASLKSSPLVRNILLIGVDGTEESTSLRSDSMILLSIDNAHCKIKLSSFMRDSWVNIPDYKYAKLNAACAHGGPQLVVDTLEVNFGVDIDDYVLVNFTMFTDIIDEIGGVNVEVTQKEAEFINKTTRHTVESGSSVHLNGAKALVYCRIRKLDSDYMRTYRQRKVIKALIRQAKSAGVGKLFSALVHVLPKIETNMGAFKLTRLVYRGGFAALLFPVRSTRIPTDDLSWSGWKGSQSVVELDIEKNAEHLQNFIYTNTIVSEEERE